MPATTAVGRQPPRAVVATTVQPWWLLFRVAGCFSERRVLGSFGASPWAAGFSFPWGILGLFASFF